MTSSYASDDQMNMPFDGAKLALYLGARLAVILRDDINSIPFPGMWDLPGGGREGDEGPLECALRETREELGLDIAPKAVQWGRSFVEAGVRKWLFVAHVPSCVARHVEFGDEGQHWALMDPSDFVNHDTAVPALQQRVRVYLDEQALTEKPPAALSGGR